MMSRTGDQIIIKPKVQQPPPTQAVEQQPQQQQPQQQQPPPTQQVVAPLQPQQQPPPGVNSPFSMVGTQMVGSSQQQCCTDVGAQQSSNVGGIFDHIFPVHHHHQQPMLQSSTPILIQVPVPMPMQVISPSEADYHTQTRNITWRWRFALNELKDNLPALLSRLQPQARIAMGVGGKKVGPPQYVIPTKVTLVETHNGSIIPMMCDAPWIPFHEALSSDGQRGTLEIPTGDRMYSGADAVLYQSTEKTVQYVKLRREAYGKTIEKYLGDVVKIDAPQTPEKTLYRVKHGTDTFLSCQQTFPSDEFDPYIDPSTGDFIMQPSRYNGFFRCMEADLKELHRHVSPPEKLDMKLDLIDYPRGSTASNKEQVDVSQRIDDWLKGVSTEARLRDHYYTKDNVISVTLNIQYLAFM